MPTTRRCSSPPGTGTRVPSTRGPGSATSPACSPLPTPSLLTVRLPLRPPEPSSSVSAITSCTAHPSRSASRTSGRPCQVSATRPSGLPSNNLEARTECEPTAPAAPQPGLGWRTLHPPNKCTAPVIERLWAKYLVRAGILTELVAAVRTVAAGEALLAPAITRRLIEEFAARNQGPDASSERSDCLPGGGPQPWGQDQGDRDRGRRHHGYRRRG